VKLSERLVGCGWEGGREGGRAGEVEGPHIYTIRGRHAFFCVWVRCLFYVFSFWGTTSTNSGEVRTRTRRKRRKRQEVHAIRRNRKMTERRKFPQGKLFTNCVARCKAS
jgi:hypothetical protein